MPAPTPTQASRSALTPAQRSRLRRIVRWSLVPIVAVQGLLLFAFTVPESSALRAVAVVRTVLSRPVGRIVDATRDIRSEARQIHTNTDELVEDAEQHSQGMGGAVNSFSAAEVSETPVETAFAAHRPSPPRGIGGVGQQSGHLGYTSDDAVNTMAEIMPGATPWQNYQSDYTRSADATLMSLRASVAALQGFHENMQEDDDRLNELLSRARDSDSRLAVGQLQVEGQMELARQIQALRAQQALQTNIYAVTESHRVGSEARSVAKDQKSNCQILAMLGGGIAGGIAGEVGGSILASGC